MGRLHEGTQSFRRYASDCHALGMVLSPLLMTLLFRKKRARNRLKLSPKERSNTILNTTNYITSSLPLHNTTLNSATRVLAYLN